MLLLLVLACICPLVSSNTCVVCQRGKYNTIFSNQPCKECSENTYAPFAGMSSCIACAANSTAGRGSRGCQCLPGLTWNIGSTACVSLCSDGLVRTADGKCLVPSNTSLVMNVKMTLMMPQNTTSASIESVIKSAIATSAGVPLENIIVNILAIPAVRRRALLQETGTMRFEVEVRVLFPVDATAAEVSSTSTRLRAINSVELDRAVQTASTGMNFRVLESGPIVMDQVYEEPRAPSTTPAPIAPTTPSTTQNDNVIYIAIGASVGGLLVIVGLLFCICKGSMPGH